MKPATFGLFYAVAIALAALWLAGRAVGGYSPPPASFRTGSYTVAALYEDGSFCIGGDWVGNAAFCGALPGSLATR
jgi:hypothetical protein